MFVQSEGVGHGSTFSLEIPLFRFDAELRSCVEDEEAGARRGGGGGGRGRGRERVGSESERVVSVFSEHDSNNAEEDDEPVLAPAPSSASARGAPPTSQDMQSSRVNSLSARTLNSGYVGAHLGSSSKHTLRWLGLGQNSSKVASEIGSRTGNGNGTYIQRPSREDGVHPECTSVHDFSADDMDLSRSRKRGRSFITPAPLEFSNAITAASSEGCPPSAQDRDSSANGQGEHFSRFQPWTADKKLPPASFEEVCTLPDSGRRGTGTGAAMGSTLPSAFISLPTSNNTNKSPKRVSPPFLEVVDGPGKQTIVFCSTSYFSKPLHLFSDRSTCN